MDTKPLWKTCWNCHILDKLYFVHKSEHTVEDTPITSISIETRNVIINNLNYVSDTCYQTNSTKFNYYLNKSDAENELNLYINKPAI